MKYYRKKPVEAIQWNGKNQQEVSDLVERVSSVFCTQGNDGEALTIGYLDSKQNNHIANLPMFGWVVIEGKTLQFYKDETFRKTFRPVEEKSAEKTEYEQTLGERAGKDLNEAYECVLEAMFGGCEKLFGKKPDMDVVNYIKDAAAQMHKDPFYVPANEDVCKDNDKKWREGMEKKYKDWSAKHVESTTFDSVLDEMKELHAKKNKDYGDSFHKSFVEFGPTAGIVRLNDKMERAKSLVKNGKSEVKDESLLDSLEDLACYAVMLYVELKNKDNGKL